MMVIGLGEIIVVLLIRPLRWLVGGQRTPVGRTVLRFENWTLHHLHVMGAESRMRYELEMHGQATGFLADGLSDPGSAMPSVTVSSTVQRVRDETGANLEASRRSSELHGGAELKRGQRQVESKGGDRSEDIHAAMLQAQREQSRRAERERRHNLRRRR